MFGGGNKGGSIFTHVDAYDTSLTRTIPTELSKARRGLAATTVGNYALFGGGYSSNIGNTVDAYDTSLTRTISTALSQKRGYLAATTVGDYALFGGGRKPAPDNYLDPADAVDAYDTSLTRTIPTALSQARSSLKATTVGSYALFGGGRNSFSDCLDAVDAYDTSLTRTIPTALSQARSDLEATTVGDCALFGGGYSSDYYSNVIDVYDTGLTRTIATELSKARSNLAATTVGDYALFGGGVTISSGGAFTQYNDVDVYTAFARSNFGNTDWATIAKVFKSGIANKIWNVGDTKTITSKSGKQYTIRIADMQTGRYSYADGSGSSNGVLEFVELINLSGTIYFEMNKTDTNAGGFASSDLRNTSLPSILADLPDDMQAAMSEVNVLSGTGEGTTSGTSSSANKLFLPAEMEMFDAKHYSIGLEECPLGQFDYYKTHNTNADRIKREVGTAENYYYWLRSPCSGNTYKFCAVYYFGDYYSIVANEDFGVAPIFAI